MNKIMLSMGHSAQILIKSWSYLLFFTLLIFFIDWLSFFVLVFFNTLYYFIISQAYSLLQARVQGLAPYFFNTNSSFVLTFFWLLVTELERRSSFPLEGERSTFFPVVDSVSFILEDLSCELLTFLSLSSVLVGDQFLPPALLVGYFLLF